MPVPESMSRALRTEVSITPARLREIGLFGALSEEVLAHLILVLKTQRVATGEIVFREGDSGRDLYVVLEGEFEVLKRSRRGYDHRVALLGPNDVFGEMSVVDMQPRSATVRSLAPSQLLRISAEDMDGLYRHDLKAYALTALNIARDLSRRLRIMDGILADFTTSVLDENLLGSRRD